MATEAQRRRRRRNRLARRQRIQQPNAVTRPKRQPRPNNRRNRRRNLGRALGREIGGLFGMPRIGGAIGNGIARITGSGDYSLSIAPHNNTLYGQLPPTFGNLTAATRIKHREYIQDVFSTTTFNVDRFVLNPGSPILFPWLSSLAHNYEQYHIHGLCIEFKSTSSNALASTNTALGVVGLVTQYDANEPAFVNKQQFENYTGAQATNPSCSMLHFVECAVGSNVLDKLYVRYETAEIDDPKFYDLGVLNLLTMGMQQGDVNIGELWVSYDIEFYKPKMPASGANKASCDLYGSYAVSELTAATSLTAPFGVNGHRTPVSGILGSTIDVNGQELIVSFTEGVSIPGNYMFIMDMSETNIQETSLDDSVVTFIGAINGGTQNWLHNGEWDSDYNVTDGSHFYIITFTYTGKGLGQLSLQLELAKANTFAFAGFCDVFIFALPPDVQLPSLPELVRVKAKGKHNKELKSLDVIS